MARDRGPQPQPSPPDDDPTFGTSWGPNGRDTQALRAQLSSYDTGGYSSDSGSGGGSGGSGCALAGLAALGGLTALGIAAKLVAAKYGIV